MALVSKLNKIRMVSNMCRSRKFCREGGGGPGNVFLFLVINVFPKGLHRPLSRSRIFKKPIATCDFPGAFRTDPTWATYSLQSGKRAFIFP